MISLKCFKVSENCVCGICKPLNSVFYSHFTQRPNFFCTCTCSSTEVRAVTYHLIVLLRLGWLTVLSSRNMVEHELYFLERSPGDIWHRKHV